MTQNDEHIPEEDLREAIIFDAVLPLIEELSKEVKSSTSYQTVIRVQESDIEGTETGGYWRVRLIVRHTFKPDRKVWRAQAIIPRVHETGFCGFKMTGEARQVADIWHAKNKGFTMLYNTEGSESWP